MSKPRTRKNSNAQRALKDSSAQRAVYDKILKLANYASAQAQEHLLHYPVMDAMMDLSAAHKQMPLNLDAMLDARTKNQFDLIHDLFGIRKHMNRVTSKLDGYFVPRFALPCRTKAGVA